MKPRRLHRATIFSIVTTSVAGLSWASVAMHWRLDDGAPAPCARKPRKQRMKSIAVGRLNRRFRGYVGGADDRLRTSRDRPRGHLADLALDRRFPAGRP